MSEAPERIWIEDEFGDGDDDQWTYGAWDVRNYRGYVVEYVRADLALPAVQPDAAALIRWHDMLLRDFGDDLSSIVRAEMLAMLDKPAVQPHVTETPKSEHDAANMLTPATKGGDA